MHSAERRYLNQARDPQSRIYADTAERYDAYLRGEYAANYRDKTAQWKEHYREMAEHFLGDMIDTAAKRGIPPEETNIAILGPGMEPVGNEISESILRHFLRKYQNIVLIDFSTAVTHSAVRNLVEKGHVQESRILPMQYDITRLLSTGYMIYIKELLTRVQTEEDFVGMAATLKNASEASIDYFGARALLTNDHLTKAPDELLGGGLNTMENLKLSVGEEDVPLHSVYAPMIFSGTGVAAEDMMWERYKEIVNASSGAGRKPTNAQQEKLEQAIRDIFELIARYNSTVTRIGIQRILHDNPQAYVYFATDTTTQLSNVGEMPRLYKNDLRDELMKYGIVLKYSGRWPWHDEPEHYHDVVHGVARVLEVEQGVPPAPYVAAETPTSTDAE